MKDAFLVCSSLPPLLQERVSGIGPFTHQESHEWPEHNSPKPEECLKSEKQTGDQR